jgi:hypothetical protein
MILLQDLFVFSGPNQGKQAIKFIACGLVGTSSECALPQTSSTPRPSEASCGKCLLEIQPPSMD